VTTGPHWPPGCWGGLDWNAGCGDDRQDTPGLFPAWQADQGDLPRVAGVAESGPEGHPIGCDRVSLRTFPPASAADRAVAGASRRASGRERAPAASTAIDHHSDLRGSRGAGLCRQLRGDPTLRDRVARQACERDSGRLRAADVCARRGLPVRLEPRDRRHRRRDDHGEGRPCPALHEPDDVCARLSARDAGDGVRRPRARLRVFQGRLPARHLRQHEDGSGDGLRRQGPPVQSSLPADVLAPSGRAGRKARSRTKSGWCASASSHRGFGSRATRI